MDTITIRMVEPDDLTACHTIEARSFPPAEAAWTTALRTRIETYPEGYLVAELDKRVVGQINSASTHKDDITDEEFKHLVGHDPDGENIVIFSLSVLPEYRSRGIASRLLDGFISHARDMGKTKVMLLCKHDLVPYYERRGFMDGGLSTSTHGGASWHVMSMMLQSHLNRLLKNGDLRTLSDCRQVFQPYRQLIQQVHKSAEQRIWTSAKADAPKG